MLIRSFFLWVVGHRGSFFGGFWVSGPLVFAARGAFWVGFFGLEFGVFGSFVSAQSFFFWLFSERPCASRVDGRWPLSPPHCLTDRPLVFRPCIQAVLSGLVGWLM